MMKNIIDNPGNPGQPGFIACLPNRLIVVVEGGEQSPIDGMT